MELTTSDDGNISGQVRNVTWGKLGKGGLFVAAHVDGMENDEKWKK